MKSSRIIKILVFLTIIFVLDQTFGLVLRRLYVNQKAGPNQALSYLLSDCQDPILIFGNSRAVHHYNTPIISNIVKMSCYNGGQDGGHSVLLPYAQIEVILNRYSPKMIIIEIDPNDLIFRAEEYDKLAILLPYYYLYPEIRPLILMRSPFERFKLVSGIYPYNSNLINLIRYNTNTYSKHMVNFKGYVPITEGVLNKTMLKNVSQSGNIQIPLDTNKIIAIRDIINLCNSKKIRLIFVNSPEFYFKNDLQVGNSYSAEQFFNIIRAEHIPYLDYSHDPTFVGHMELFADRRHLNEKGSTLFSIEIAQNILNNYLQD
jgi:hypothetical protein